MGREREALRSEPLVASERDVVALVAHELRHPLAAIEMALPLLMDAPQRESRQKARRVVERQVVYLRRLVNDLLDAERARRGNLQLEKRNIDLRSIVGDTVNLFRARAQERGVDVSQVTPSRPVVVKGDPVRLQQVVANILDNAVKHTPSGGSIRVRLATRGRQAVLSVRDTGDGISPHVMPHMFEPFRHYGNGGGLGIGLNVARRLVDLHGGRISARSDGVGKGAEFVIDLPVAACGCRRFSQTGS
jgi:signal transduction histidine kinase